PVTVAVLFNDSDPDGDPLTVISVTSPLHGSAVINVGTTITYTPAASYTGPDSFQYAISDAHGGSGTAAVNINVGPVPLRFIPVTPCRIMDTRSGSGFTGPFGPPSLSTNTTRTMPIPAGDCGIPTTAKAYSLNATVVPHGFLDFLTLWPTGLSRPLVS